MNRKTRQRQGRDFPPFSIHEYLKNAGPQAEVRHTVPDETADTDAPTEDGKKKSVMETLERLRAEAEENAAPVDGHEPQERGL